MDKIENEVSKRGLKYSFHDNVSNALSAAVKDSNESDTILVTGSTFLFLTYTSIHNYIIFGLP